MEDNESSLVQCPKCGNIQSTSGKCLKCGLEITPPSAGENLPGEDARDIPEPPVAPEDDDIKVTGKFRLTPKSPEVRKTPPPDEESRPSSPAQPPAPEDHGVPEGPGPAERLLVPIFMPIGRFITLSIITLGVYQIFWFYRNWKILKSYHDRYVQPGKLTLMMLIPFYGIYLVYKQLSGIHEMTVQRVRAFPVIPVLVGWILLGSLPAAVRPDAGLLLSSLWLGSVFLLMPVQWSLNRFARSSGHSEPSPGSRKGWMAAAMVLIALILTAGITESINSYRLMEPFRAETAGLDAASASTSSETRDLLIRYGSYIERSRRLINTKSLRKSDRQTVYNETNRIINDLPRKLHCLTRNEVAGIRHGMVQFILKDNSLMSRDLANINIGISEIGAFAMANSSPPENKEGLEKCTSEPFDLKAFVEEMKQAKSGAAQGDAPQGPTTDAHPKEDPGVIVVKEVSALLKACYQETGKISTDANFLFENYAGKAFNDGHKTHNMTHYQIRKGAVYIKSEGNTYRIAVENPLGTNNKGERISKWVVCSGTIGGSETIETIDQAPSGVAP